MDCCFFMGKNKCHINESKNLFSIRIGKCHLENALIVESEEQILFKHIYLIQKKTK